MIRKEFGAILSSGEGVPCVYEEGGATERGVFAVIVADQMAKKPTAIFIPRIKNPCGQHALIPVRQGYFIIEVGLEKVTQIWRIMEMDGAHLTAELVQEYVAGRWSVLYTPIHETVSDNLNEAINAAWKKADDPGCCEVYWATAPRHYAIQGEA